MLCVACIQLRKVKPDMEKHQYGFIAYKYQTDFLSKKKKWIPEERHCIYLAVTFTRSARRCLFNWFLQQHPCTCALASRKASIEAAGTGYVNTYHLAGIKKISRNRIIYEFKIIWKSKRKLNGLSYNVVAQITCFKMAKLYSVTITDVQSGNSKP